MTQPIHRGKPPFIAARSMLEASRHRVCMGGSVGGGLDIALPCDQDATAGLHYREKEIVEASTYYLH
jgi:hypothetical protein